MDQTIIIRQIKEEIAREIKAFSTSICDDLIYKLTEDEILKLQSFINNNIKPVRGKRNELSIESLKLFILLFLEYRDSDETNKVLSFLQYREYGWHDNKYIFNNNCFNIEDNPRNYHCKYPEKANHAETAECIKNAIAYIFYSEPCGMFTLYIFSYCLASLFSSILNRERISVPYFLQIECDRNSVLYKLIQEIVEICDVNSGFINHCIKQDSRRKYCGYIRTIVYPTQPVEKDMRDLITNYRDIPIIIDGHENERGYNALLREIANITGKRKPLDIKDNFNIFPIFTCPSIKSTFENVLSLSLTELEISSEYIKTLQRLKTTLASWVLEMVKDCKNYLLLEADNPNNVFSFNRLSKIINLVSQNHTDISLENAKNVGILSSFFKGCMAVYISKINFKYDKPFENEEERNKYQEAIIKMMENVMDSSTLSLVEFHKRYLPMPISSDINNKEAVVRAKEIEKAYKDLRLVIRVTPKSVEVNKGIFTFRVDTLQNTKDADLLSKAETVQRRLRKYEVFLLDFNDPKTITLTVSETQTRDNGLLRIIQNDEFINSKMKIPYAIGYKPNDEMCITDLVDFPHLLIGGTTQSGKSTAMLSMLMSIAYKFRTGDASVLILDLLGKKESTFELFEEQPFLAHPIVSNVQDGLKIILHLVDVMSDRLTDSNKLDDMPYIICFIDEFPEIIRNLEEKDDINKYKKALNALLAKGRHAKIHLVLAAQDPKKPDMVCNMSNVPARIAFRCSNNFHSVAILGRGDASKLIGKGNMIFDSPDEQGKRLLGSFISPRDIKEQLKEIKNTFSLNNKYPFKIEDADLVERYDNVNLDVNSASISHTAIYDSKYAHAVMILLKDGKISSSKIQAKTNIANKKANEFLSKMESLNLIPPLEGRRSARMINPLEEVNVDEVMRVLSKEKNYLINKGYTENEVDDVIKNMTIE